MTIKRIAIIFGAVFTLAGILGFIPAVAPVSSDTGDAMLLGIFAVNPMHNLVHIITGVLAIGFSFASEALCRLYFKVFGVLYALVTLIGFAVGHQHVMGVALNMPDAVLHLLVAAFALVVGFASHLPWEGFIKEHFHRHHHG
jgi:hypothetical protein